ncbi:hypothetical protein P7C73_g6201, partial [Tremellales sp. Uapishka_1]
MANPHESSLTNHDPTLYHTHANFVYSAKYTSPLFDLLSAQPGESILDLGCGTGELTRQIKALVGAGEVWGVDSSQDMLDHAASIDKDITYICADIQKPEALPASLAHKFDKIFSCATFHWCKTSPGGVLESIKYLLKPGGKVVFEFGGFGNTLPARSGCHQVLKQEGVDPDTVDPWYFPTVKQYQTLLTAHGLTTLSLDLIPRPTPLPTDIVGWLSTFARNTFFHQFDDGKAAQLLNEVQEYCRPSSYWSTANPGCGTKGAEGGEDGWEIMYVRLRGVAQV